MTKYVVLSTEGNGTWKVEGTLEADDAKRAIREHIAGLDDLEDEAIPAAQWVAVPASSWRPVTPTIQTQIVLTEGDGS